MEKLTIQPVRRFKLGITCYLWVNLITETENRQCLYISLDDLWIWSDGDKEPAMSETLRARFHGKIGQSALTDCYKKATETTIGVVNFENNKTNES